MAKPNVQKDTVLLRQRVTEKAALATSNQNVHVFEVTMDATKHSISKDVKKVFGITPDKVRVVPIPKKTVQLRNRRGTGTKGGGKKAYIYLKKGDKIEIS